MSIEDLDPAMRLLIIDDDATFAATMARALARRGMATVTAHAPETALELARDWAPSHVLLDLNLYCETSGLDLNLYCETSGLDLIEPLLEITAMLCITVLTGYAGIATTVTAMQRGAGRYLAKPVDAPTVIAALTQQAPQPAAESGERMSLKPLE